VSKRSAALSACGPIKKSLAIRGATAAAPAIPTPSLGRIDRRRFAQRLKSHPEGVLVGLAKMVATAALSNARTLRLKASTT
jgi:hypothetical protein